MRYLSYILKFIVWGCLLGLIFNPAYSVNNHKSEQSMGLSTEELKKLNNAIAVVKQYYYRDIQNKHFFKQAINGILSGLDPYSVYLDDRDLKNFVQILSGRYNGIGVEIFPDHGAIRIVTPLDDTPATRAGLKPGDLIIQINHQAIQGMSTEDAISMLHGKAGAVLSLTIMRKGIVKPFVVKVRREIIKLKTVKYKILEPGYGYVRLAIFQDQTEREMVDAIIRLVKISGKGGLKGLVLDLRNNPGGLLESAVQVADDFLDGDVLKGDKVIVYTKGQVEESHLMITASSGDILPDVPVAVLINEGTASSAEIVAGALQDHKRAIVIGNRSFGKGSVQTIIPLGKNDAIKLTTATYYTPKGRSIQDRGIEPNLIIDDIKFTKDGAQVIPRIDDGLVLGHIKNVGTLVTQANLVTRKTKLDSALAREDYQLYEALNVVKSQNVIRNPDMSV